MNEIKVTLTFQFGAGLSGGWRPGQGVWLVGVVSGGYNYPEPAPICPLYCMAPGHTKCPKLPHSQLLGRA